MSQRPRGDNLSAVKQTIIHTTSEAVPNREATLTRDGRRLAWVTLESEPSNVGSVIDARCYGERRGVHCSTTRGPA
jgi:hypothetical protein